LKGASGGNRAFAVSAKTLAVISVYAALIVAAQFVLSFAAGVELVSLMIIVFSVAFGPFKGVVCTLVFVLIRGFVFPYVYPNIVADYALYFPALSLVTGLYGILLNRAYAEKRVAAGLENEKSGVKRALSRRFIFIFAGLCLLAAALTPCFTLIDNLVYPKIAGLGAKSAKAYFYSSLPTLAVHTASVTLSVIFLFLPAYRALVALKRNMGI